MCLSLFLPEQLWPEDQDQTSPHELPRNCHHRLCVGLRPVGPHWGCYPLTRACSQSFLGEQSHALVSISYTLWRFTGLIWVFRDFIECVSIFVNYYLYNCYTSSASCPAVLMLLLLFFFFLCNSTYVGNKVGIYFSVNRGSCVSRQLPMPSWPMPLIKKPLLALVSLSKSPSSHLCVSVCVRGSLPKRTCQLNGYHWDGGVQHNFVFVFMFFNLYSYILNHKYAQLEWCCLFFLIKVCFLFMYIDHFQPCSQ